MVQGMVGMVQGMVGMVQGMVGMVQGMVGMVQGMVGMVQGMVYTCPASLGGLLDFWRGGIHTLCLWVTLGCGH